jgi:stage II sporulation protein D
MRNISLSAARILLLIVAVSTSAQGQSSTPRSHPAATLRVGLWTLWHDKEVTASVASGSTATIRLCEGCASSTLSQPTQIHASASGLNLSGNRQAASISLNGAFILTAHGESSPFHNAVRITANKSELILVVTLPIESYVERVVASESGTADSLESLKALAIVVRTFALHEQHGHADYDLCDSTHCQLLHWSGRPDRRAAAHAATLATAGETLWFHGQRAAVWFHQNCGGRTASPNEAWPSAKQESESSRRAMPWLVSRADPYCTAKGAREWSAAVSLADLTAALASAGLVRPGWKTITVKQRGESGRAVTLQIGSTTISAEDFRLAVGRAMGWGKILSTWFEVAGHGTDFFFHGRGSGHGVGLCQAGAAAMSALGRDSSQILAQYFPGATVADEATGLSWQTMPAKEFALETLTPADTAFLSQLTQALGEAEARSGMQPAGAITVRAFRSTAAFRDGTLAPGWVAAFTEGNWIGTQPLSTLDSRKLLVPVLRHEFLHALIEEQAAPATPLWLREGLVEVWADEPPGNNGGTKAEGTTPTLKLNEVDVALAHAATDAQSEAAHRAAAWYAQRMLDRYGRVQVLDWLHSGLPSTALDPLR